jgi:hypothetical protein
MFLNGAEIGIDQIAVGRSVHLYMGRLAETTPEMLTNTKFAHELEYRLIGAMGETLSAQASGPDTAPRPSSAHHKALPCSAGSAG